MKTRSILLLIILFSTTHLLAQSDDDYWANWDKNYPEASICEVLNNEKNYADSVDKNPKIEPYYVRIDKYRFKAKYLGKERKIDKNVLASMKRVFKLTIGDPSQLDSLCQNEALFEICGKNTWMPIQLQILSALKEEVNPNESTTLYCLFLNEHDSNHKLYNSLLVSEFNK